MGPRSSFPKRVLASNCVLCLMSLKMFSISKNDVSEFLKKEKNTNEFYGSFFSFFPLPIIHLVIPMESRELGATRDPALQHPSFSFCFSLLLLASNYSFVFLELSFLFNYPLPRSLSKEGGEIALRFLGLKN